MILNKKIKNLFKKKNFTTEYIILTILILIFVLNIDLFRKSYFVAHLNHDERQRTIAYDYCEGSGTGYIFYIKNKYNLTRLPKILNYGGTHGSPPQNWVFKTNHVQDKNKLIVLFNLNKDNKPNFDLSNYKIKDNHKNDCFYLIKK